MTIYKFKALTLPICYSENSKKTQTVIEAKTDVQLVFLYMTEEIGSNECAVILDLHLLIKVKPTQFSAPFRILQFDVEEFRTKVIQNNCILPKEMFFSRCKLDLLPTQFHLTDVKKKKSSFSKLYVKTYMDFNSFFNHLYRNLNYGPHKMYMIAFYSFVYGLKIPFYVVSEIYDRLFELKVETSPNFKDPFYLMSYLIRKQADNSFEELESAITQFGSQVQSFYEHSIETYLKLNDSSKNYTQDDMGGIVCSYALTKCFQYMRPNDIILESTENYRKMTDSFNDIVQYYEKRKYEEIDSEIRTNVVVSMCRVADLTRYILKRYADPLFGLNTRKGDLQHSLSKALLEYYGNFPPPHIDLRASSILCEMMAGAFSTDSKFASEEVLKLKPFKPILVKCKDKEYRTVTLNGLNIDKPISNRIIRLIQKHIDMPSVESYMNYCYELVDHINKNDYFYHETINPFLPIYTINMDIDIYDKQYIKTYYESDLQWEVKWALFESLKRLVLYVSNKVMSLPVTDENTTFYFYESARTDLNKINSKKFKLGVRLIVKFTTVCFKNRTVVNSYLKVLNLYRIKFEHLKQISDDNIFDSAIYGQSNHEIRLPLNLKSDGSKPLIPIFFQCHRNCFQEALCMTSGLVHYRNFSTTCNNISYIQYIPIPTEETIDAFGESSIYKNIYCMKSKDKVSNENCEQLISFTFSDEQKQVLIDVIDRFSMGRLKKRSNRKFLQILENRPLIYQGRKKFNWCSGLKFCAINHHENSSRNPCDYYVTINPYCNKRYNKRECFVFCHCFSTTCKDMTKKNCIAKCLL